MQKRNALLPALAVILAGCVAETGQPASQAKPDAAASANETWQLSFGKGYCVADNMHFGESGKHVTAFFDPHNKAVRFNSHSENKFPTSDKEQIGDLTVFYVGEFNQEEKRETSVGLYQVVEMCEVLLSNRAPNRDKQSQKNNNSGGVVNPSQWRGLVRFES